MSATVVAFPTKKRTPNTVEIQFDLGRWTIAYFNDRRFMSRLAFASKADAEAEAKRLLFKGGMTWRCGPNGAVYIWPDDAEGGCWAVAHRSRSDDSDALLARHFSLDDAITDAVRQAQAIGAEISVSMKSNEGGIA